MAGLLHDSLRTDWLGHHIDHAPEQWLAIVQLPGLAVEAGHAVLLLPGHCLPLPGRPVQAGYAGLLLLPGHCLLLPGLGPLHPGHAG